MSNKQYLKPHPQKGLNHRPTICPKCGKDTNVVILLGKESKAYKCPDCGQVRLGQRKPRKCKKCDKTVQYLSLGELPSDNPVPGYLCPSCVDIYYEVLNGGVMWECTACHSFGVIPKDSPLAKDLRKGKDDGAFLSVQMTQCPQCTGSSLPDSE